MTETLKVKTGITPKLKKYVFKFADAPYNLRNQSNCNCIISCTEKGIETASSIGTKLWEKFPTKIINFKSFEDFKVQIKS